MLSRFVLNRTGAASHWRGALVTLAIIGLFALAWLATPLRAYANLAGLITMAEAIGQAPLAPVVLIAAYIVGGFLFVPLSLLQVATGLVFGSWPGLLYAMLGSLASAALMYWLGQLMGEAWLRRWFGPRIDGMSRKVAHKGVAAMFAIRMVPVAPFSIVNVAAGASHISLRDYLLGTTLGMIPGTVIKVVFTDQIAEATQLSDFTLARQLVYVGLALLALGLIARWLIARRLSTGGGALVTTTPRDDRSSRPTSAKPCDSGSSRLTSTNPGDSGSARSTPANPGNYSASRTTSAAPATGVKRDI